MHWSRQDLGGIFLIIKKNEKVNCQVFSNERSFIILMPSPVLLSSRISTRSWRFCIAFPSPPSQGAPPLFPCHDTESSDGVVSYSVSFANFSVSSPPDGKGTLWGQRWPLVHFLIFDIYLSVLHAGSWQQMFLSLFVEWIQQKWSSEV